MMKDESPHATRGRAAFARLLACLLATLAGAAAAMPHVAAANSVPRAGVIAPASGSGRTAILQSTYEDADGWRDLGSAHLLLNTSVSSRGAAYFKYDQNANRFYVFDGTVWRGGYAPRARAVIRTAFGVLSMSDTYAYGSGPRLTVRWRVGFASYMYNRNLRTYLYAKDDHVVASGWRRAGSWSVPAPAVTIPPIFPGDNPWNSRITTASVHPNSAHFINSIGASTELHADFGTVWDGAPNGIPYCTVGAGQVKVPISFYYPDESDPGPYPIPPGPPVEKGPYGEGDRHILIIDTNSKLLYEVYDAHPVPGGWSAGSGAIFDLTSNRLRPDSWTSADAAGLPIFPGLVRYDEVAAGAINHALRFTVPRTQRGFIHPATHFASDSDNPDLPPMGLRLRLKAGYDLSSFPRPVRVILQTLKTYGMFVADNGGPWYISGAPDARFSDDELHEISRVRGRDFEVVYTGPILGR